MLKFSKLAKLTDHSIRNFTFFCLLDIYKIRFVTFLYYLIYFVAAYPNVNVEEIGVDLSKNQNKQDTVDSSVAVRGKPNLICLYIY